MQAAVSEDHRAAILTAQLTVPLADVKQDMRCQFMDIRDYPSNDFVNLLPLSNIDCTGMR